VSRFAARIHHDQTWQFAGENSSNGPLQPVLDHHAYAADGEPEPLWEMVLPADGFVMIRFEVALSSAVGE